MRRKYLVLTLVLLIMAGFPAKDAAAAATWVSTSPLPPAYVGVPYSHQLQATTATPPILYSITGGSIPGLSLSPSGLITGTVTAPGLATVTIQALDASPVAGPVSRTFTISYLPGGVTGDLRIKRLQVRFANNRPEITVAKDQPPPRVAGLRIPARWLGPRPRVRDRTIHVQREARLARRRSSTATLYAARIRATAVLRMG